MSKFSKTDGNFCQYIFYQYIEVFCTKPDYEKSVKLQIQDSFHVEKLKYFENQTWHSGVNPSKGDITKQAT